MSIQRAITDGSPHSPRDEVVPEAAVVVNDFDLDAEEKFTLVGIRDVDYGAGKIRVDSPLARGLLRKKGGRQGCDQGPRRDTQVEILSIRFVEK